MIKGPLATVKSELSGYMKKSARDDLLATRRGKPDAAPLCFADEDAAFDYHLEHDERFRKRMAESCEQARSGNSTRLEDLPEK